jgi:hypothetical protein
MKRVLIALAVLSLSVACGSSPPTAASTLPAATFVVQSVVFSFSADLSALTTAGATVQATALGIASNGSTRDVTSTCTTWQSDNLSALTVTNGGLITVQGPGGVSTITATCQGVAARVTLALGSTIGPPAFPPRFRVGATCTDGWASSATGSGACSSHGGVRCWMYSDGTCTNP